MPVADANTIRSPADCTIGENLTGDRRWEDLSPRPLLAVASARCRSKQGVGCPDSSGPALPNPVVSRPS